MRSVAIASAILFTSVVSEAATIAVNPDGSGDHTTIQAAVDAAADGDVIILADGVYTGEGNWRTTVNKAVTIKSAGGRDACSVEGVEGWDNIGGLIVQSPGKQVVIEGLTISHGRRGIRCVEGRVTIARCIIENNSDLGGIQCASGPATICECIIRNNQAAAGGGGISSASQDLQVVDCVIESNRGVNGGGIETNGSGRISRCIIRGNVAGYGGGLWYAGACQIDDSIIVMNNANSVGQGGGIYSPGDSLLVLANSVVADNQAGNWGGGICLGALSAAYLKNSIVYGNQAPSGRQLYVGGSTVQADCCIMPIAAPGLYTTGTSGQVVIGEGVQDITPGFLDAGSGDYRLRPDSPCIDAGSNDFAGECLTEDAAGQERVLDGDCDGDAVADIGAYEFVPEGAKVIRASKERVYFTQIGGVLADASRAVRVSAEGGELAFSIAEDCGWLEAEAEAGTADADGVDVSLRIDTVGLAPGAYTGEVTISAAEAVNRSETIMVALYVVPEEGYWVPFHYPTIQAALEACPAGGTVIVADGEYGGGIVFPERAVVVKSATGPAHCRISVGRYTNQGITLEDVSDGCRLEGFTVSGATNGVPIIVTGGSGTIANCRICYSSPVTDHAVMCDDSRAVLQGCTLEYNTGDMRVIGGDAAIRECTIKHNVVRGGSGFVDAGIRVSGTGVTQVSNCAIMDNICAGISGYGDGTLKVSGCSISQNAGGGIYIGSGTYPKGMDLELNDSVITDNSSVQGCGVYCIYEGVTEIRNCTISKNFTWANIGEAGGAGIYAAYGRTLNVFDSMISENTAAGSGGGIWCEYDSTLLMDNCRVSDNESLGGVGMPSNGGGICLHGCAAARIRNSFVSGNVADMSGGGIYSRYCYDCEAGWEEDFVLENCVLSGNRSLRWYGGGFQGGGVLVNCTLAGNRSLKTGSGASMNGRIINSVLWGNLCGEEPGAELYARPGYGGSLRVDYCDFPGGVAKETAYDALMSGAHNMDADPMFAAAGHWADGGTAEDWDDDVWVEGDYHLRSVAGRWDAGAEAWIYDDTTSPCIDAGDPTSEWRGELWPHGGRIDMGSYGGTREASMSLNPVGNVADLDYDGVVGLGDFGVMALEWRAGYGTQAAAGDREGRPCIGDLDRDGVVGLADLAALCENW